MVELQNYEDRWRNSFHLANTPVFGEGTIFTLEIIWSVDETPFSNPREEMPFSAIE